ncbi:unnamed protein product [Protopolystoma xenopodis]|uniref:PI3K/PI4K catalytic domain-containing protein n=1 Tax=Protopolystoma xenopodis TaxID=117903 RepID=A0A448WC35_9PLAT|nr:unnamed protein product [Protopolystoma xenopodis]
MIRTTGHVFHIDFAKVFGDSEKFARIKRDRVPFVFTSSMLYVLNELSKETERSNPDLGSAQMHSLAKYPQTGVQRFIDLCCEAYNLLRRHAYSLLAVLELTFEQEINAVYGRP